MNQNPYQQQPPQQNYQYNDIESQIKALLSATKGWIMFLGIINIVYASLYTIFTLGIGIIVAWVPFILGIFLISAANKIKNYLTYHDPTNLVEYHKQMKNFFVTKGVLIIIGIALGIIAVIVALVVGISFDPNNFNLP